MSVVTEVPLIKKDDGTQKVNIFQSDLVRLGSVSVLLKSDAMTSKYPKGSATHYCYMDLGDGCEKDYCLAVEPECVRAINDAPKGEWLHLKATGSKDEPAALKFASRAQPEANPGIPAPMDGPPPMWPDEAPKTNPNGSGAIDVSGPVTKAVALTAEAVHGLQKAGFPVDSDGISRIYISHFIHTAGR